MFVKTGCHVYHPPVITIFKKVVWKSHSQSWVVFFFDVGIPHEFRSEMRTGLTGLMETSNMCWRMALEFADCVQCNVGPPNVMFVGL